MVAINFILWALKTLASAVVLAVALGIILLALVVVVEVARTLDSRKNGNDETGGNE